MFRDSSGSSAAPDDGLRRWEEEAARCCVPLVVTHAADLTLSGSIQSTSIADACVSLIAAEKHIAEHDTSSVDRTEGEYVLACLQLKGAGELAQDGRRAPVRNLDFVFFDSARPFHWTFAEPFEQIVVRFPKSLVALRMPLQGGFVAHTISGAQGLGLLAAQHLITLCAERDRIAASSSAPHVVAGAADLLGGLIAESMQIRPGPRTNLHLMHLQQVRLFISNHLQHPDLDAEMVASALGISTRYLHRLVQSEGTSIGRIVLAERLQRCAQWLSQRSYANRSIEQVAAAWGFSSAAHFSRTFRAQFMMSPREYRAMHQPASR
ncbi:MAG TPA: helix-turn-helix domain-containing protein [Paraburkholderia sp.]